VVGWTFPQDASPGLTTSFVLGRGSTPGARDVVARVESVDSDGLPRNGLETAIVITTTAGLSSTVTLDQESPGVYSGVLPDLPEGAHETRVVQVDGRTGLVTAAQSGGLVVPYQAEYSVSSAGDTTARELLDAIMRVGNGRRLDLTDPISSLQPTRVDQPRRISLWPWLLATAILLFPIDVALRRINVGWSVFSRGGDRDVESKRAA
jgi:hypothetical protein